MCIYWQLKTAQHNPTIDNDPIDLVQKLFFSSHWSFISHTEFKVLCSYRVDEPYGLVELQKNEWDPVLQWTENR